MMQLGFSLKSEAIDFSKTLAHLALSLSGRAVPSKSAFAGFSWRLPPRGVKSSCYSPNFIEQTAHCDHKPRAAWMHVRLLLHRRSAAGSAE